MVRREVDLRLLAHPPAVTGNADGRGSAPIAGIAGAAPDSRGLMTTRMNPLVVTLAVLAMSTSFAATSNVGDVCAGQGSPPAGFPSCVWSIPVAGGEALLDTAGSASASEVRQALSEGRAPNLAPHVVTDEEGALVGQALLLLDAGAIAPLHKRGVDRSLRHCPHLRGSPDVHVRRFPATWTVIPLLIDADEIAGRRPEVIGFLQLCGVTRTIDRRWRCTAPPA